MSLDASRNCGTEMQQKKNISKQTPISFKIVQGSQ